MLCRFCFTVNVAHMQLYILDGLQDFLVLSRYARNPATKLHMKPLTRIHEGERAISSKWTFLLHVGPSVLVESYVLGLERWKGGAGQR